jgi:hypothetical protein
VITDKSQNVIAQDLKVEINQANGIIRWLTNKRGEIDLIFWLMGLMEAVSFTR